MYQIVKRVLDFTIALVSSVVFAPLFLLIVLAIRLDTKGPILFRQQRIGKDKAHFAILKFRTMRADSPHDVPTHLLQDPDAWITRVGHILRKTSLDELPQLFNILAGQMAFVGPRPALWNQYDLIAARDRYTGRWGKTPNQMRPGLTGWAQINGRDRLAIEEKAAFDGEYARRIGFFFDLKCFLLTFLRIFRQEDIVTGDVGGQGK